MLFAGKMPQVESYTADLLKFQLGQADKGYAAMSLCNLTQLSLEANQFEFAAALAEHAVELEPNDPVVFTNRAEVFKQRGQFNAALMAYEEAIHRFPDRRYALNGKADVLHEMGRFSDSLNVYSEAEHLYPDDPVAFNGARGRDKERGAD